MTTKRAAGKKKAGAGKKPPAKSAAKKSAPKGSSKKKGGKPDAADDEQEPVTDFRREGAAASDESPDAFDQVDELQPGEQPELPTMETERIPAVERKAKEFAGHEDKKKEFSAKAKVSGAELIALMIENDIVVYNKNGIHVDLSKELKVKVELE